MTQGYCQLLKCEEVVPGLTSIDIYSSATSTYLVRTGEN